MYIQGTNTFGVYDIDVSVVGIVMLGDDGDVYGKELVGILARILAAT